MKVAYLENILYVTYMEIIYFITGIVIAVAAVLVYQYRYMLSSIKSNINNIKSVKDGYDVLSGNQSSIIEKLAEDNYATASQMNSNISSILTKLEGLDASVNSLANRINKVEETAKNDKLEVIKNLNAALRQQSDNRQY